MSENWNRPFAEALQPISSVGKLIPIIEQLEDISARLEGALDRHPIIEASVARRVAIITAIDVLNCAIEALEDEEIARLIEGDA